MTTSELIDEAIKRADSLYASACIESTQLALEVEKHRAELIALKLKEEGF